MSTPWWFFLIAAGLIVMSGFFSGLNLGLMSLAPDELKVVMEGSADEQAKRDAAKIYPLRKRGNLLLCTLLLGNTLVNALIAVLLADAMAPWINPTGAWTVRVEARSSGLAGLGKREESLGELQSTSPAQVPT